MNKILIFFLLQLFNHFAFGQTASDYYQSPSDTFIQSKYLQLKKDITVILPRSFSKSKASKFPLIIVFDRQNKRIFRQIFESVNYMVSFDEMPESVIIGVSSNNNERTKETSFSISRENGMGELTDSFIFDELIPFAEKEYNINQCNILIGHSRYGFFTSYLLSKHLSNLTAVISCSPLFIDTKINLVDSLKISLLRNKPDHAVYYRFITGDSVIDTKDYSLMKSYLTKAKIPTYFKWKGLEFYDATHMVVPGLGVMPSLLEIFAYWKSEMTKVLKENKKVFSREEYKSFLQKTKKHYGDNIGLGLAILNGIGFKYYGQKKYLAARQTWEIMLEEYPMYADAYINIANSYAKDGNKALAMQYYEIAKINFAQNNFYSQSEKQEALKDIDESEKKLQ